METGRSYLGARTWRTAIGVTLAAAALWGAWLVSAGGQAATAGAARAGAAARTGGADVLRVDVSGVRSDRGLVIGSLCREGEVFVAGCSLRTRVKAADGVVALEFKGLATGNYALALFHDENDNAHLELGAEGIGFSNNTNLAQAAPDFAASRIQVAGSTRIRVRLRYPAN